MTARVKQSLRSLGCWLMWSSSALAEAPSTAFFYGPAVPEELARAYQQVVVEPAHVPDPSLIAALGAEPVAYFSVGERARGDLAEIDARWVLGRNPEWSSLVLDLRQGGYRRTLFDRFDALFARGYRRFFLDTLDSYLRGVSEPAAREEQRRALVEIVRALATRHVGVKLLLNRGFEILPEVAHLVHGVVAESLFDRWDAERETYGSVPAEDRAWLLARLREARDRYGLSVTVIDYRPAAQRAQARATAQKIRALGFQPWVCNANLTNLGIGSLEIVPRRVLILTDTSESSASPARFLEPVLEYLGYVPERRTLGAGLPERELGGRYAGIVTWLQSNAQPAGYAGWLLNQIRVGVPVAMFGAPGLALDGAEARELGLAPAQESPEGRAGPVAGAILESDALIGFEGPPPAHPIEGHGLVVQGPGVTTHLAVQDSYGRRATAIATAPWGGVALSHMLGLRGLHGEAAWVLDPFGFLERALQLPPLPVPDVTTESGRRVAMFVIQLQGLGERARLRGRPVVASVLRDQVLTRAAWPHAIDRDSGAGSAADRRAARALLPLMAAYPGRLGAGNTDARVPHVSLTRVQGMTPAVAQRQDVVAPIAGAAAYMTGGSEAYPFIRVLETLQFTESPRRLKPIALTYPGLVAASPGGVDALQEIYAWLHEQSIFPMRVDQYAARALAFREQVIARDLDGAFSFAGGEALRSVRVPLELGLPDRLRSRGITVVRRSAQGTYVSFGVRERKLVLGLAGDGMPHVLQANGWVSNFEVDSGRALIRIRLRVASQVGVELELAGLPPAAPCQLQWHGRRVATQVRADGGLSLRCAERDTGQAVLRCLKSE